MLSSTGRACTKMAVSMKLQSPIVEGIVVVGFHHSKGSVVEFVHPKDFDVSVYKYLVHQALPDGAHNVNSGTVCFVLQSTESTSSGSDRFVVSCFRQMSTDELAVVDSDTTRGTIQKAVCVIMRCPTYGIIDAKLKVVTEAYFNTKDMSNTSVLVELYDHLVKTFASSPSTDFVNVGLDVGHLFSQHRHKPLQLFKALLLGQTVMLYSSSAEMVCKSVLGIASLIPSVLTGLIKQPNSSTCVKTGCWRVQPYLCLQQMEDARLHHKSATFHLYGTANPLFERKHSELCDLFFNLNSGQVNINNESLKSQLSLTLADLRFIESLMAGEQTLTSEGSSETLATWHGSDDYIRKQFKRYLQSLYTVSETYNTEAQGDFNSDFVAAFRESPVLRHMNDNPAVLGFAAGREGIVDVVHPCHSSLSFDDVKLSVSAQVRDLVTHDQWDQIKSSASSTSDRITRAWTSVVNWWNSTTDSSD